MGSVRRLVLLLVGAQLSALCLWLALSEAAAQRRRGQRPSWRPRAPMDPRVTVPWQGSA